MTIYAIEVQAHTGAGGVQTFYAADARLNTGAGDTPANQHFHPSLETPANFERHLFSDGTTSGASSVAFGEVVLANAHGRYDAWADYAFDGRPIIIRAMQQDRYGEPVGLYRDAPIMIRGTIESLDITDAFKTVRLRIHDRLADLDAKPLLTTKYLGTTTSAGATAEGPATLKDTIKPRAYGLIRNVTPIDVNPFNLIRQVSDRACTSITVYDGGQPLTLQGDYATIAALHRRDPDSRPIRHQPRARADPPRWDAGIRRYGGRVGDRSAGCRQPREADPDRLRHRRHGDIDSRLVHGV